MTKIIAFTGSNHSKSINQHLLKHAANLIENHEVEVLDLRDYESPMFSLDLEAAEGQPAILKKLEAKISESSTLLIAVPEYNGFMPSFFKNTIDWLSRINIAFLKDKKVILLSTSPGKYGGKQSLEHTASILPRFGGEVIATFSLGSFYEAVNLENGFTFTDVEEKKKLNEVLNNI
jgi:chromate reductase